MYVWKIQFEKIKMEELHKNKSPFLFYFTQTLFAFLKKQIKLAVDKKIKCVIMGYKFKRKRQ